MNLRSLLYPIIFVLVVCGTACNANKKSDLEDFFPLSNSVVIIQLSEDGRRVALKNCDSLSYFEGASLSKTIYNIGLNSMTDKLSTSQYDELMQLLNHSNGVENRSSDCKFNYSDSSYIQASDSINKWLNITVSDVVSDKFEFIYTGDMDVLDGYVQRDEFARNHKIDSAALPNGTAYLNAIDGEQLLHLTNRYLEDVKNRKLSVKVCDYKNLYWENGLGLDSSLGRGVYFQWGSNWCYNHLLLVDPSVGNSYLILTNSVIGASEIAAYFTDIYNQRLELFDYIRWY